MWARRGKEGRPRGWGGVWWRGRREQAGGSRAPTRGGVPGVLRGGAPSPGWGSSTGGPGDGQGGVCTRGGGKLEGDSLVRDAAHVSYRHLAGVAGIVLGPQILQLQDLGLPLGSDH